MSNHNLIKPVHPAVYPSEQLTVTVETDEVYGGAHKYHFVNCLGFHDGKTVYTEPHSTESYSQSIQFVHKADDGTITPGLQSEQLIIALIDRHKKMNERFPSPQNQKMIECLEGFLAACQERIDDRIGRNVMGKLTS